MRQVKYKLNRKTRKYLKWLVGSKIFINRKARYYNYIEKVMRNNPPITFI